MKVRNWVLGATLLAASAWWVPGTVSAESHESGDEAAVAAEAVDYEAIAIHYEARAAEAKATAAQHRIMAKTYKRPGAKRPAKPQMAKHCEKIADNMDKAAEAFSALAKEYRGGSSAE